MENSFSVNVCIFASHALQELKTLKAWCFVRFYIFFRFDFFPFLLFSKLDFQDIEIQLQDLTSFKTGSSSQIYQDRKIHLPTPEPPTPNQIEQDIGDEENQLAVTAKFCIDSDPTSMRFIVWRARYGLDYARFIISNLLIN